MSLSEQIPYLAGGYKHKHSRHVGHGVHGDMTLSQTLKAPFPWFGGKRTVAGLVWSRLGNVDNFVEPFAGSCAVLLLRPHPPRIETLNDADSMVANFWRATQQDPDAVVSYADGPVSEVDLHSRHRWLVLSDHAKEFRERMRTDPDYFDPKVAGWWCWGLCCWIGGGWCATPKTADWEQRPDLNGIYGYTGRGVHSEEGSVGPCGEQHGAPGPSEKRPRISGPGQGTKYGDGVHAKGPTAEAPQLADTCSLGRGVHAGPSGWEQRPILENREVNPAGPPGTHGGPRPSLGDVRSDGRGVHSGPSAGTCAARRAWLLDWFGRLRDRLRNVRVCCGDWTRVCSSESVTTRLGLTGVMLDPPYGTLARRAKGLYAQDSMTVAEQVRRWCLERGPDLQMRIALCGYAGEGHEVLEQHRWECVAWEAGGGYGNRTKRGKANAKKERIWFSPACEREPTLFDNLEVDNDQSQP